MKIADKHHHLPSKNGGCSIASMAMTQEPICWRYLPCMRPMYGPYRGYDKIWPETWRSTSMLLKNPTNLLASAVGFASNCNLWDRGRVSW